MEEDCRGCVGERAYRKAFDLHSKLAIDIRSPTHGESREPRIKAYNFHVRRNVSLCARTRSPADAAAAVVHRRRPAAGANMCIKHDKSCPPIDIDRRMTITKR